MLASGMTEDEILNNCPYLEKADFQPSTPTLRLALKLLFDANLPPQLVLRTDNATGRVQP